MANFRLKFEPEKGKIHDFKIFLSFIAKNITFDDYAAQVGIKPNDVISRVYDRLYNEYGYKAIGIKLLFSNGEKGLSLFDSILDDAREDEYQINTIEDALRYIELYNIDKLICKILAFYDKNNFTIGFYENIINNKELLIEFLDGMVLDNDIKCEMIQFFSYPKIMLNSLFPLFRGLAAKLESEYKLNERFINEYYNDLKKSLTQEIIEKLADISGGISKKIKDNLVEEIEICFSLIAFGNIQWSFFRFKGFLALGLEFNRLFDLEVKHFENKIEIFKAFSDKHRVKILELLKTSERSASEIAGLIDVPLGSLAHHFEVLSSNKVIIKRMRGKKAFYSMNRDALETSLDTLANIYS